MHLPTSLAALTDIGALASKAAAATAIAAPVVFFAVLIINKSSLINCWLRYGHIPIPQKQNR
jgi:hypothetical protein